MRADADQSLRPYRRGRDLEVVTTQLRSKIAKINRTLQEAVGPGSAVFEIRPLRREYGQTRYGIAMDRDRLRIV